MSNRLMHFEPFNDLARFDSLRGIEDFFRDFHVNPSLRALAAESRIKVDVTETEQAYLVKAEIPGVKKEDIHVDVERNQVTIKAETKRDAEDKQGGTVVRSERYWGEQFRSFTLAQAIDEEKVAASYKDGVLELTLPKKQPVKGKKVQID